MSYKFVGPVGKQFRGDKQRAMLLMGSARLLAQRGLGKIEARGGRGFQLERQILGDGSTVEAWVNKLAGQPPQVRVKIWCPEGIFEYEPRLVSVGAYGAEDPRYIERTTFTEFFESTHWSGLAWIGKYKNRPYAINAAGSRFYAGPVPLAAYLGGSVDAIGICKLDNKAYALAVRIDIHIEKVKVYASLVDSTFPESKLIALGTMLPLMLADPQDTFVASISGSGTKLAIYNRPYPNGYSAGLVCEALLPTTYPELDGDNEPIPHTVTFNTIHVQEPLQEADVTFTDSGETITEIPYTLEEVSELGLATAEERVWDISWSASYRVLVNAYYILDTLQLEFTSVEASGIFHRESIHTRHKETSPEFGDIAVDNTPPENIAEEWGPLSVGDVSTAIVVMSIQEECKIIRPNGEEYIVYKQLAETNSSNTWGSSSYPRYLIRRLVDGAYRFFYPDYETYNTIVDRTAEIKTIVGEPDLFFAEYQSIPHLATPGPIGELFGRAWQSIATVEGATVVVVTNDPTPSANNLWIDGELFVNNTEFYLGDPNNNFAFDAWDYLPYNIENQQVAYEVMRGLKNRHLVLFNNIPVILWPNWIKAVETVMPPDVAVFDSQIWVQGNSLFGPAVSNLAVIPSMR